MVNLRDRAALMEANCGSLNLGNSLVSFFKTLITPSILCLDCLAVW